MGNKGVFGGSQKSYVNDIKGYCDPLNTWPKTVYRLGTVIIPSLTDAVLKRCPPVGGR